MKKHIPNLITSMNALCGTAAIISATMYSDIRLASLLIIFAMIFDFFDGMSARLLHVKSDIGKELDSLSDVISFGIAPAILAFILLKSEIDSGQYSGVFYDLLGFLPLIIAPFSAYRLAKFNLDSRQTTSFIGMPTPANALFWIGLVTLSFINPILYDRIFGNIWILSSCIIITSVLLISEIPMFSLKISNFSWGDNKIRYIYLLTLIVLFFIFKFSAIALIIPLYIVYSLVFRRK